MSTPEITAPGGTDGAVEVLSTGHEVELPLETRATITGAAFTASRAGVQELLPEALTPIRVTPSRAAVAFLCVDYERIGRPGAMEPYNEFGVLFPAVPEDAGPFPTLSVLSDGGSGYVWYLPVTTEPAKALGVDVWGFPKVVADIEHHDEGSARQTSVSVDGQSLIDVTVERPPTFPVSQSSWSYTTRDGEILRERLSLHGELGGWPVSRGASYTLGDHPRARQLADLDIGARALVRFGGTTGFTIHEGRPLDRR
jgi:hypothetical protein